MISKKIPKQKIKFNPALIKMLNSMLKIDIIKNDKIFKNTLYITILNIKKENRVYNLNSYIEKKQYIHKYFNLMNELFISFNSYLLHTYIKINKIENKDPKWESIYDPGNKKIKFLIF